MDGIQQYQRDGLFKRGWNYRGLWRESLNEQPSAASVYRWLLIAFICLYVLSVCVNSYSHEYVGGILQSDLMFTFPSIGRWIGIAFFSIVPFIVYSVLWDWGKIKNNRHIISASVYLIIFLIGVLVAHNVGSFYKLLEPIASNLGFLYKFLEPPPPGAPPYYAYQETHSIWYGLYGYLKIPTLLVPPILVMWIQGWRQAFIFSLMLSFPVILSPTILFPFVIIMRIATGRGL